MNISEGLFSNPNNQLREKWIGTIINNYTVLDVLGHGSSGITLKVVNNITNQDFALKLLPPELANLRPDTQKRFDREASILQRLKDQVNIIALEDRGFYENIIPYQVKRYKDGGNLRKLLNRYPDGLDFELLFDLFDPIASALDRVHEMGVIHRDLKPENIVLQHKGNGDFEPFINDFGMAILRESSSATQTWSGGTPHYKAREAWIEAQPRGESVDLYSFGVMVYEALEGQLPFNGTQDEIMYGHVNVTPPRPFKAVQKANGNQKTADTILKMLNKHPKHRFSTASSFMRDLKESYEEHKNELMAVEAAKTQANWAVIAGIVGMLGLLIIVCTTIMSSDFSSFLGRVFSPNLSLTPLTPIAIAKQDIPVLFGPGNTYPQKTTLVHGSSVDILGISEDGKWYRILLPDDTDGWIRVSQSFVDSFGNLTLIPTALSPTSTFTQTSTYTPTNTATGIYTSIPTPTSSEETPEITPIYNALAVAMIDVNLRSGPGANYPIIGGADAGEDLTLLAQAYSGNNAWYLIELQDNKFAWVWSGAIEIITLELTIPTAVTIPPLPATAIKSSTPTPSNIIIPTSIPPVNITQRAPTHIPTIPTLVPTIPVSTPVPTAPQVCTCSCNRDLLCARLSASGRSCDDLANDFNHDGKVDCSDVPSNSWEGWCGTWCGE